MFLGCLDGMFLGSSHTFSGLVFLGCLDGMFLGVQSYRTSGGGPGCLGKNQMQAILGVKNPKIFCANFPIIPKPELFGAFWGDLLAKSPFGGNSLG